MKKKDTKRHGVRDVLQGPYKGSLHVTTHRYQTYFGELLYLNEYLCRRVLPKESEEVAMRSIVLNLQNFLEYLCELLIVRRVDTSQLREEVVFKNKMLEGYVSFKAKFSWLKKRKILSQSDHDVMEEMRVLRNELMHFRPASVRKRPKYCGSPLMTLKSLRKIFIDAEAFRMKFPEVLPDGSWPLIPPGYSQELNW